MGGNRWTEEEEEFLVRNVGKLSVRQIAEGIGRTKRAIIRKREKMGLSERAAANKEAAERRRERKMELVRLDAKEDNRILSEGMLSKTIRLKTEKYLERGTADLSLEIAQMKAIRDIAIEWAEEGDLDPGKLNFVMVQIERVGQMVERIVRIMNQTALTQAEVRFIQSRIIEIIGKYVPEALQDACTREIIGSLGVRDETG